MCLKYSALGPLEEALVLTTDSRSKNIILGALDLHGPMDPAAIAKAIAFLGVRFPHLRTCLTESGNCLGYSLIRNFETNLTLPLFFSEYQPKSQFESSLDSLIKCIQPGLNRERNLFKDPLIEFHLVKLHPNRHLMACVMNHVAADAITLAEIVREFIQHYHELVTGEKSPFTGLITPSSIAGKRSARKKKTVPADYWRTFKQAIIPYQRCSLPFGSGIAMSNQEHYVKRLLTSEETRSIMTRSVKSRVPFVDYLMASIIVAIDAWNHAHKTGSGKITAALTVNMQGRFQELDCPNNDSVLYFGFESADRQDVQSLARLIYRQRGKQYREQMDLKYSRGLAKMNKLLSILPFESRKKAMARILLRHQTSFALGFLGVLWPETSSGRLSSNSYLTTTGGLEIVEAHGVAVKIVSSTPLYLTAYFFRKRLNLILSAQAWKFTKKESENFLDLSVKILKHLDQTTV